MFLYINFIYFTYIANQGTSLIEITFGWKRARGLRVGWNRSVRRKPTWSGTDFWPFPWSEIEPQPDTRKMWALPLHHLINLKYGFYHSASWYFTLGVFYILCAGCCINSFYSTGGIWHRSLFVLVYISFEFLDITWRYPNWNTFWR